MRAAPAPRRRDVWIVCVAALLSLGAADTPSAEPEGVVASRSGFRPQILNGRRGEALLLRLTTADHEHCFAVDGLRVEKRIVPGRATVLEVTPEKAASFDVHCCLHDGDTERARLVVSE